MTGLAIILKSVELQGIMGLAFMPSCRETGVECCDDKLFAFEQLHNDILKDYASLKQTIIRGNQGPNHIIHPYVNEKWRKIIRHRNKLWRKFTEDRTDTNYEQYKIQRNKCASLRRKAIKKHFLKKSTSCENPGEFWNVYCPFLHGKTKQEE